MPLVKIILAPLLSRRLIGAVRSFYLNAASLSRCSAQCAYRASFYCLTLCFVLSAANSFVDAQSNDNSSTQSMNSSDKKLMGMVEQTGSLDADKGKGLGSENGVGNGEAGGKNNSGYLKGSAVMGELDAAHEDPDADDKELMIAWDRWRNRFLQAVLASTSEMLNSDQARSFQINPHTHVMEPKYPVGTVAWFVCEVTGDRQIKRLRILNTSGFAEYDQTVLEAVQALQGSSLLRFPSGSRRRAVLQGGAVERAAQAQNQYFRFGDVERYRIPSN